MLNGRLGPNDRPKREHPEQDRHGESSEPSSLLLPKHGIANDEPSLRLVKSQPRDGGGFYELYREVPATLGQKEALLYITKGQSPVAGEFTVERMYRAVLPNADKVRWVENVEEKFSRLNPEYFEAFFSRNCGGSLIFEHTESGVSYQNQTPVVHREEFFRSLGSPVFRVTRQNGSYIRVYRDAEKEDFVLTLSASGSPNSDSIAFRIKDSQHWRNFHPLVETLSDLTKATDKEIASVLRDLILHKVKESRGVIFRGTVPTSGPINDLLNDPSRSLSGLNIVLLDDNDTLGFSRRTLLREGSLLANYKFTPPEVDLHFGSVVISSTNRGIGRIVLTVAHKEGGRYLLGPIPEPVGKIAYEFNLSDLSPSEQQRWLGDVLRAYKNSGDSVFGELSKLIEKKCGERLPDGRPRMAERSRTEHLELFTISERKSLDLFVNEVCTKLAQGNPRILAHTDEGAVIEATNRKGDRIQLTVKPTGIEEIFILPRLRIPSLDDKLSLDFGQSVGFSLVSYYQLGIAAPTFLKHLADLFIAEGGRTSSVCDIHNTKLRRVGAHQTYLYLTALTSGSTETNCIVGPLPSASARCKKNGGNLDLLLAFRPQPPVGGSGKI